MYVCKCRYVCTYIHTVYGETSLIHTSDIQFPHLPQQFTSEQICNNPTVHYTTAPLNVYKYVRTCMYVRIYRSTYVRMYICIVCMYVCTI